MMPQGEVGSLVSIGPWAVGGCRVARRRQGALQSETREVCGYEDPPPRATQVTASLVVDDEHNLFAEATAFWMDQAQQCFDEVTVVSLPQGKGMSTPAPALRRRWHQGLVPRDPPVRLQPRRPRLGGDCRAGVLGTVSSCSRRPATTGHREGLAREAGPRSTSTSTPRLPVSLRSPAGVVFTGGCVRRGQSGEVDAARRGEAGV
ncbi:hypothetical protein HU200_023244 [Digitaria exilis]|uniref:Uncharacterized protein n=1 Tax=Digitaria exilis TaxID=1010633 RepID=A0A835EYE4_9POAL|nr:hypothetical protein HU200_023244 [Digitaria exilis]